MASPTIYRILTSAQWQAMRETGLFRGSEHDQRDGFIHFSAAHQLAETAAKHYAGQADLCLLHVRSEALADALKWEPSRGGAAFPHLYAPLPLSAVLRCQPLPQAPDGSHQFPDL